MRRESDSACVVNPARAGGQPPELPVRRYRQTEGRIEARHHRTMRIRVLGNNPRATSFVMIAKADTDNCRVAVEDSHQGGRAHVCAR